MIASFSNSFIFQRTRKTAGTSVETVLGTWCSGRDIVTPFGSEAEEQVRAELGGRPMNFRYGWRRQSYRSHQPAADTMRLLPGLWAKSFKFAVERHPYERVVSLAFWRIHRQGLDPDRHFEEEVERVLGGVPGLDNRRYYCIDDRIAVDEVIHFDRLWPRLAEIAASFGRKLPEVLPKAKGTLRTDRRPAADILSPSQKLRVYELTRRDFDDLGFER